MKQFILKYKKNILIILGVFTLIFLLIGNKGEPKPKITSLFPADKSDNVDLRFVPKYQIDIPIILSEFTITSVPNINFQLSQPNEDTLAATHTLAFQPATAYTITLSYQNQVLQTHSFTTIKSQEDPLLIQNMKDELARDYPLAQKLPYTTSQYRVVYSAPMTLEITIKNPNLTSQEAIEEIKTWVIKNGGNVEAHKYTISSAASSPNSSKAPLSTEPIE
jgi:hypothetical protein